MNLKKSVQKIFQYDRAFQDIKFKNETTIRAYGSAVTSVAMAISYLVDDGSNPRQIIKDIVETGTNANGDFTYGKMKVLGKNFNCFMVNNIEEEINKNTPVVIKVQKPGDSHYVLCTGYGTSSIKSYPINDPGYGKETVGEVLGKLGAGASITKKFIVVQI